MCVALALILAAVTESIWYRATELGPCAVTTVAAVGWHYTELCSLVFQRCHWYRRAIGESLLFQFVTMPVVGHWEALRRRAQDEYRARIAFLFGRCVYRVGAAHAQTTKTAAGALVLTKVKPTKQRRPVRSLHMGCLPLLIQVMALGLFSARKQRRAEVDGRRATCCHYLCCCWLVVTAEWWRRDPGHTYTAVVA